MAEQGPLQGKLQIHFYDTDRIKTASIVSYGLRHIVAIGGAHSLHGEWKDGEKDHVQRNREALARYIQFCASELGQLFSAFKSSVGQDMWTTDKKVSRALTTTSVNGVIYCMRLLIENRRLAKFESYAKRFEKLTMNWSPKGKGSRFKSSNWKSLGDEIYKQCFAT